MEWWCKRPGSMGISWSAAVRWTCVMALVASLSACDYARMKEDEALRTYETAMPQMPAGTIPVENGVEMYRQADPKSLQNPLPAIPETVARGRESYRAYCGQCHGPKADGRGTVGQSFAPLPTNLASPAVQGQSDGELFYKTSFGFQRHPPLADTVSVEDRWAIIRFIRTLGTGPVGQKG